MGFLRLWRLAKWVKGFRTEGNFRLLYEARAVANTLLHSFSYVFWAIGLMVLVNFLFAVVCVQAVAALVADDPEVDPLLKDQLIDMAGTVSRAMLTLYMTGTGGIYWKTFYDVMTLTGNFGCFIVLAFVAFFQISVVNVFVAVVTESCLACQVADRGKKRAGITKSLCYTVRAMRPGRITENEFREHLLEGGQLAHYLNEAMGLEQDEALRFFQLLCDEHELISAPGEAYQREVSCEVLAEGIRRTAPGGVPVDLQAGLEHIHLSQRKVVELIAKLIRVNVAMARQQKTASEPTTPVQAPSEPPSPVQKRIAMEPDEPYDTSIISHCFI